ncbi:MAG: UDP-N-acetylmuramate--L-alanine ligase [Candidatus Levybacteria bacterium RIFCSPHIGHO2_12_FULL_38_12]|nr:MAG: UDP-N-acetylmuramate--L-alanine ligase [Candidatus Levybacteria bacterium RIFCSPHIGHO2_01_FULL_38_12]OGH21806.1 MAG: UDP-N-acetylmuramate--L-alanine ligase [Candidatus Levybacteria bacterium RIFCSPHIGHO2_02_FULL_37_18]OGH22537.1 MAG: UDP-N-acetylmuramate--L-alanine ligase [Candidatus Levybacteria bacterium RIFCSPHIGHO2_12_FULL_38_12]OGH33427.1 MAG: UDP-N-acetylmuramate--L-alanine ligase [Candidatus Levybacteria bacterium RIFCSPLOWO2_01_FULL_37_20]OGH44074.1 MAG: UDP-N-acetylmuramate--L-
MSKKIHFVGIKGVGMTPLAILAKEAGFEVSGCDIDKTFITDEALDKSGIQPLIGFSKGHVKNIDLVITTSAHGGFDNEEVKTAKALGVKVLTQGQAVGAFMNGSLVARSDIEGISITGSHGKTTTTSIIATIFFQNNLDPSYVIGTSHIPTLPTPGHFGKGRHFIVEADEYATEPTYDKTPKFLWQKPKIAIITNIELDHPDIYNSEEAVVEAFFQFVKSFEHNGLLIAYGDDKNVDTLFKRYKGEVIRYGFSSRNDFFLKNVSVRDDHMFFWVETKSTSLGEFAIGVTGEHNALNALASIICSLQMGIGVENIRRSIRTFAGLKRRAEFIGKTDKGALVFDDYGHHPTEVKKTLLGFRKRFSKSKIVCIFQPHTYSRTKILFDQFIHSFSDADEVIITNIYASQREKPDSSVDSRSLAEALSKFHAQIMFLPELSDVVKYIGQKYYDSDWILLTMGAGDVYTIGKEVVTVKHE